MRVFKTSDGIIDSIKKLVILPNGKEVSFKEMDEMVKEGKNINRIYKPFILLYYTDFKNGKSINQYCI